MYTRTNDNISSDAEFIEAGSTNLEGDGDFQRNKIWMMRAPNKVKTFVLQHNIQHTTSTKLYFCT